MNWKTKAFAFRLLSATPLGSELHFLLQRHLTKNWPRRPETIQAIFDRTRKVVEQFGAHSDTQLSDALFLEVGAGRDLTASLSIRALGVKRVVAVDIERLARLDLVNHAAGVVAGLAGTSIPRFSSWDELKDFGLDYKAPSGLEGLDHCDAFVSNEVLEHVPHQALKEMVRAAYDLLPNGGLAIHSIDYSDHFARGGAVSRYNFLKYSDEEWAPYNSSFQFVNRLRHSEYLSLFEEAGFSIKSDEPYAETIPEEVNANLAAQFRAFSPTDLSIMRSNILAVK